MPSCGSLLRFVRVIDRGALWQFTRRNYAGEWVAANYTPENWNQNIEWGICAPIKPATDAHG